MPDARPARRGCAPARQVCVTAVLLGFLLTAAPAFAQTSRLDAIRARGHVLVGTTGDFRPFTFLDPGTGRHEGFDIDAARRLGEALGVEVRFVSTTWATLVDGLLEGRYDVAMGGITRTLARAARVGVTDFYFVVGKCPLVRAADVDRYKTLADIDRPGVRVAVNPGGTNEAFVRARIRQADVIVVPQNLSIPDRIVAGDADVMITDNVEAILVARERPALAAVEPDQPFTRDDFGYLAPRDDQALLNWLNLWIHQMKAGGGFDRLRERWIGPASP